MNDRMSKGLTYLNTSFHFSIETSQSKSNYYTVTHIGARTKRKNRPWGLGYLDEGGAFTLVTPMIRQKAACFVGKYVSPMSNAQPYF